MLAAERLVRVDNDHARATICPSPEKHSNPRFRASARARRVRRERAFSRFGTARYERVREIDRQPRKEKKSVRETTF